MALDPAVIQKIDSKLRHELEAASTQIPLQCEVTFGGNVAEGKKMPMSFMNGALVQAFILEHPEVKFVNLVGLPARESNGPTL